MSNCHPNPQTRPTNPTSQFLWFCFVGLVGCLFSFGYPAENSFAGLQDKTEKKSEKPSEKTPPSGDPAAKKPNTDKVEKGKTEAEKAKSKRPKKFPKDNPNQIVDVPDPTPWKFRPYKVTVWLISGNEIRWNSQIIKDYSEELKKQMLLAEPSAWRVSVSEIPAKWKNAVKNSSNVVADLGQNLYDDLYGNDKLFIVRLDDVASSFEIKVNEVDLKAWSNGPTFRSVTFEQNGILAESMNLIHQAFRPVVRIENREDREALCLIRGYGLLKRLSKDEEGNPTLVDATSSPCWVQKGEVFEPVLRRKRKDYFSIKDIQIMDFTLLVRKQNQEAAKAEKKENSSEEAPEADGEDNASEFLDKGYVHCDIVSARRPSASLGRRYGRSVERVAMVVRNPPADTTIRLITRRGRTLQDLHEVPLSGYEIYSRPITKDSKSELVGKTDWKGEIVIPPGKHKDRVRVLLVKSGSRRLARLPLMPGYKALRQITLPDDEDRLRAEGVVSGLHSQFLDLFARRGVIMARLKLESESSNPNRKKIEALYKQYKGLKTIPQWNDHITSNAERLSSIDPRQSRKINAMFKSLRDISKEFLDSTDDEKIEQFYSSLNKK